MSLKRYLDSGGDWTPIVDLPPHLVDLIVRARPLQTTEEISLGGYFVHSPRKCVSASDIAHSSLQPYVYNSNWSAYVYNSNLSPYVYNSNWSEGT